MLHRYTKHYTLDEARALLPQIRGWLKRLREALARLAKHDKRLQDLSEPGRELGGEAVNKWVRNLADLKEVLLEFERREIQIKDLDRGLMDFPAILDGKEVFLCWEQKEDDIGFWHELDSGFGGREPL